MTLAEAQRYLAVVAFFRAHPDAVADGTVAACLALDEKTTHPLQTRGLQVGWDQRRPRWKTVIDKGVELRAVLGVASTRAKRRRAGCHVAGAFGGIRRKPR